MKKKFLLLGLINKTVVNEVEVDINRDDEFRGIDVKYFDGCILGIYEGEYDSEEEAYTAGQTLMESDKKIFTGNNKYLPIKEVYTNGFEIRKIYMK